MPVARVWKTTPYRPLRSTASREKAYRATGASTSDIAYAACTNRASATCVDVTMALDRRHFIRSSLELALLAATASLGGTAPALASSSQPAQLTLFDGRFQAAREAALAWASGSPTRAVGSDITDVVLDL